MRLVWSAVGLVLATSPLAAQGLRDKISELFIFSAGKDPLFLGGTADPNNPAAIQLHADHFIPAARAENGSLISFISNAVSGNVANIPVSATSGGSTFRFEGGVPVRTSVSPGPVFAERAQTLGRGRVFVGANINHLHFATLRGVRLNGIEMTFTHENVTGPVCDSIVGTSCTPYGVPMLENDVIAVRLAPADRLHLAARDERSGDHPVRRHDRRALLGRDARQPTALHLSPGGRVRDGRGRHRRQSEGDSHPSGAHDVRAAG